jgi:hypothetical protein
MHGFKSPPRPQEDELLRNNPGTRLNVAKAARHAPENPNPHKTSASSNLKEKAAAGKQRC